MNENITVLKDESLGGIEREYREVKRKACEGERIKIVSADYAGDPPVYRNGDVLTVLELRLGEGEAVIDRKWNALADENAFVWSDEYVVLEPTDIIRIDDPDGVNRGYRMVDRKAAVGERVIITNAVEDALDDYGYTNGQIHEVKGFTGSDPDIWPDGTDDTAIFLEREEYRVLEPVETAKTTAPTAPLSAQSPLDQAAANISALQAQVKALESRVASLEKARQPVKVAEGPVDDTPPSFAGMPRAKSLQQIRDEIVERAKADVKRLAIGRDVDFVVNREKRAVVALICGTISGRIRSRGIAKCAPGDVFNAHIGRAIALRRALGLEVPAEYLNVPNPEEPRVGDVVDEVGGLNRKGRVVREMRPRGFGLADEGLTFEGYGWAFIRDCKIIDDSREEVGA